ncbi:hypothetical protein DXG01_003480 [Tephrocybe rancida]|nr:hypothetical protein DXG01_003480 [Tephrocybe rancida]
MHPTAPTSQHTGSTRSLAPPTATPQSTFTSVTTGSSISEYTTASSSSSTSSAVSSPPTTVVRENSLAMIAIIVGSIAGILLILNISDLSDGVFSKDRFVPRSPSRNSVEGITHVGNGDDTEPPESQQNTIVNPEPDHYPAAEMLREENERLRAENELLRLVGNGGHSQPKRISRFRLA